MAKTITVLPATATIKTGRVLAMQVRVQNGDAAALRISDIQVKVTSPSYPTSVRMSHPMPVAGGGARGTASTPAGVGPLVVPETTGDVSFPFSFVANAPLAGGADVAYTVDCTVTWSDGTQNSATTSTVTVQAPAATTV